MCAACFCAAQLIPATAAAGRAMIVRRTMRKTVEDATANLDAELDEALADDSVLTTTLD